MKKHDSPEQNTSGQAQDASRAAQDSGEGRSASPSPTLSEKQRRELWLYIAVSIAAVEFLIAVGAVFYGFMAYNPGSGQAFAFPWISWGAIAVMAPTLILLLVHFADVGLFRPAGGASSESEWQERLPSRLQRIYSIIKGAPVVAVLLCIILLGFALMTLDGALSALMRFGNVLVPYIPHIAGAIVLLTAIFMGASAWLSYRTRRIMAEYEFRREVLAKTGVIIVDKGSTPLPPGGTGDIPYAIAESGDSAHVHRALPSAEANEADEGEIITAEAREIPKNEKNTDS